jgi:hypothetical protein
VIVLCIITKGVANDEFEHVYNDTTMAPSTSLVMRIVNELLLHDYDEVVISEDLGSALNHFHVREGPTNGRIGFFGSSQRP